MSSDSLRLGPLDMTLASLVRWDSVLLVQRFRSPAADAWFTHFPLLGNEVQYALAIPLLAWYAHDTAVLRCSPIPNPNRNPNPNPARNARRHLLTRIRTRTKPEP